MAAATQRKSIPDENEGSAPKGRSKAGFKAAPVPSMPPMDEEFEKSHKEFLKYLAACFYPDEKGEPSKLFPQTLLPALMCFELAEPADLRSVAANEQVLHVRMPVDRNACLIEITRESIVTGDKLTMEAAFEMALLAAANPAMKDGVELTGTEEEQKLLAIAASAVGLKIKNPPKTLADSKMQEEFQENAQKVTQFILGQAYPGIFDQLAAAQGGSAKKTAKPGATGPDLDEDAPADETEDLGAEDLGAEDSDPEDLDTEDHEADDFPPSPTVRKTTSAPQSSDDWEESPETESAEYEPLDLDDGLAEEEPQKPKIQNGSRTEETEHDIHFDEAEDERDGDGPATDESTDNSEFGDVIENRGGIKGNWIEEPDVPGDVLVDTEAAAELSEDPVAPDDDSLHDAFKQSVDRTAELPKDSAGSKHDPGQSKSPKAGFVPLKP